MINTGTGRSAKIEGAEVFGKTGTAQNPQGKDHAWFVSFAQMPGEPAEIAVAVLVEHGLHGASAAGPIAREVMMAALGDRLPGRPAMVKTLPAARGYAVAGSTRPHAVAPVALPPAQPLETVPSVEPAGATVDNAGMEEDAR